MKNMVCAATTFLENRTNVVFLYVVLMFAYMISGIFVVFDINEYSWTEIFISYEAGYIRRGLLGSVLFAISHVLDPRIAAIFLYACALFAFFWISYRWFCDVFDSLSCFLVFFSPALYLFYIGDPNIFARKDMYLMLSLVLMFKVAAWAWGKRTSVLYGMTVVYLCLYVFSYTIHEMAIFFMPLSFLLLGVAYHAKGQLRIWFCLGLVVELASLYVASRYSGNAEQRDAIRAAWQMVFPAFQGEGAISYIGLNFSTWTDEILRHFAHSNTVISIGVAFVLGAIPVLIIGKSYHALSALRQVNSSTVLRVLLVPAVLAPFVLMSFAQDFGRFIAAGLINILFFLAALQQLSPQPKPQYLADLSARMQQSQAMRATALGLALVYGFSWTMVHSPILGESLLRAPWWCRFLQTHVF